MWAYIIHTYAHCEQEASEAMLQCLREVDPDDIEKVEPECAGYVNRMVAFTNMMAGGGAKMMKQCKMDIKVWWRQ